ncbi:MAG: hypothetical protein Q8N18_23625 [Opitutaceae bacterium]|nr:hypothetical protein [Opitutaceae bacterium]
MRGLPHLKKLVLRAQPSEPITPADVIGPFHRPRIRAPGNLEKPAENALVRGEGHISVHGGRTLAPQRDNFATPG